VVFFYYSYIFDAERILIYNPKQKYDLLQNTKSRSENFQVFCFLKSADTVASMPTESKRQAALNLMEALFFPYRERTILT
jgi:hypothetical protein